MRIFLSRPRAWLCVIVIATLTALLWSPVKAFLDVAAVRNSVQRDWEISFGYSRTSSNVKPRMLPASLDRAARSIFERIYEETDGNNSLPTHDRNREIIAHERFRALFRGPIEDIHIYYFEGFRGDLGAVLARFPDLHSLTVIEPEQHIPTEAEWTLFCTRLRTMESLDDIELGGEWITGAALAPLRGHPGLRKLAITHGRLTAGCTETFRSLPHLSSLHIEDVVYLRRLSTTITGYLLKRGPR